MELALTYKQWRDVMDKIPRDHYLKEKVRCSFLDAGMLGVGRGRFSGSEAVYLNRPGLDWLDAVIAKAEGAE